MCLTETQISSSSHCDSKLGTFTLIPNTDDDRFSSLFVGLRESVELIHVENCPGSMFFKLLKKTLHKNSISFLLLYRKNH